MRITIQIPEGIKEVDYKKAITKACRKVSKEITKHNGYYFKQCITAYRMGKTL